MAVIWIWIWGSDWGFAVMVVPGREPPPPEPLSTRDYALDANIVIGIQQGNMNHIKNMLQRHVAYGGRVFISETQSHEATFASVFDAGTLRPVDPWFLDVDNTIPIGGFEPVDPGQKHKVRQAFLRLKNETHFCFGRMGDNDIRFVLETCCMGSRLVYQRVCLANVSYMSLGQASPRTLVALSEDKNLHTDLNIGASAVVEAVTACGWPYIGLITGVDLQRGNAREVTPDEADTPPPPASSRGGQPRRGSHQRGGSGPGVGQPTRPTRSVWQPVQGKGGGGGMSNIGVASSSTLPAGTSTQREDNSRLGLEGWPEYTLDWAREIFQGYRDSAGKVIKGLDMQRLEFVCDKDAFEAIEASPAGTKLHEWAKQVAGRGKLFIDDEAGKDRRGNNLKTFFKFGRLKSVDVTIFPNTNKYGVHMGDRNTSSYKTLVTCFVGCHRAFVSGNSTFIRDFFVSDNGFFAVCSCLQTLSFVNPPYVVFEIVNGKSDPLLVDLSTSSTSGAT